MTEVQGTQSISKALKILKVVASSRRSGISSGRIVSLTNYSRPTVHRLLKVLLFEGMIKKNEDVNIYYLGPECNIFGMVSDAGYYLNKVVDPFIKDIANSCQDSAFLCMVSGDEVVCVLREDGEYPVKTHILQPGVRLPLGIGAGALAILSERTDTEIDDYLSYYYEKLVSNKYKFTSKEQIKDLVNDYRKNGYAVNKGCVDDNSWGIGVSIISKNGGVLGSVSIAAIKSRLTTDKIDFLGSILKEKKREIEYMLNI